MTDISIDEIRASAQPVRRDGLPHPTPVEFRIALYDALAADERDPKTPRVPSHVYRLIREAFARANNGEFING